MREARGEGCVADPQHDESTEARTNRAEPLDGLQQGPTASTSAIAPLLDGLAEDQDVEPKRSTTSRAQRPTAAGFARFSTAVGPLDQRASSTGRPKLLALKWRGWTREPGSRKLWGLVSMTDPTEFETLYHEAAPATLAWIALHVRAPLRSELDPEDLLQEVVARAFAKLEDYDPERGSFRGWLFGFARNVLNQALERVAVGGRRIEWSTQAVALVPDSTTTFTRRVARAEETAQLTEALDQLPEEDRLLVGYRGLEELPLEEVARRMGLTLAATGKRWERLRAKLREVGPIASLFAE